MKTTTTTTTIACPECGAEAGEWCKQYEWVRDYFFDTMVYKQTGVRAGHLLTHSSRKTGEPA